MKKVSKGIVKENIDSEAVEAMTETNK